MEKKSHIMVSVYEIKFAWILGNLTILITKGLKSTIVVNVLYSKSLLSFRMVQTENSTVI